MRLNTIAACVEIVCARAGRALRIKPSKPPKNEKAAKLKRATAACICDAGLIA
jgi:hypothetical protein